MTQSNSNDEQHSNPQSNEDDLNAERYTELDFNCEYSDNIPKILKELNISLAFTSYQAGRLMMVRSDGDTLDVNYKSFQRPMGLSVSSDGGLTLGTFTQVVNFQREDGLLDKIKQPLERIEQDVSAPRIKPKGMEQDQEIDQSMSNLGDEISETAKEAIKEHKDNLFRPVDARVDACYITRSSHYSGMINIHDIAWGDEGLWAVNSSFSCLCTLDPDYSFIPRWKPYFISDLAPQDRCHLNGMTLKDGKPAYVTTFSTSNESTSWREKGGANGTLMDVESNRILIDGLMMPHSPRWYNEQVYFCNSGLGLLCSYSPQTQQQEVIAELQGFTRGMDFYGPLAFVGLSKTREGNVLRQAPLIDKYDETFSGIWIINLQKNEVVGHIKFTGNVDQIYDVAVLPECSFPELIEPNHPRMRNHFCHPELQEFE